MKLFAKYNRINITSTILIFLLGCLAFFLLLRYIVIKQVDEDLKIEKNEILTYVNRFHHLPNIIEVRDQYTTYQKLNKPLHIDKIFTHTAYEKNKRRNELQRTIEFAFPVNDAWYLADVSKSLEETNRLIASIIIITITIILLILVVTFFINRVVLKKLWRPFYNTLETLQQFKLSNKNAVQFNNINTDEFQYLNTVLTNALSKAQQDYQTLKEFTENASHELQTPLAVIQSKLDLLIQDEHLSENESGIIQSAYDAVQNLNKLNQSLLLLAKIENKQFSETTVIDLKEMLQNKLSQFNDLWKSRNIQVQANLSEKSIRGNKYLVEILLNNLLSNATKHNIENGFIHIILNDDLEITNSGILHSLDESFLYKRFSSQNKEAGNYGLGLSIVQQICIASGYTSAYNFSPPNVHTFRLNFHASI
jgi:signal transduction histidine kinase